MVYELVFACMASMCVGPIPHEGDLFTRLEDCQEVASLLSTAKTPATCSVATAAALRNRCILSNIDLGPTWHCLWADRGNRNADHICGAHDKEWPARSDGACYGADEPQ